MVSVTGTATQGKTLSATDTLADVDGLGAITYHWLRDGVDTGATGSTYLLTAADVDKAITARATYTDLRGTTETVTSPATSAVLGEHNVPSAGSAGTGDGNGDGQADNQQANVESLLTLASTPAQAVWATLVAPVGTTLTNLVNAPAPSSAPASASLPFGVFNFDLPGTTAGLSRAMSVYLTGAWALQGDGSWLDDSGHRINGYWKQDADGVWSDIATAMILDQGKRRIDFTLTDGDPRTDADGLANGTIHDPGAPGFATNTAPVAGTHTALKIGASHTYTVAEFPFTDSDGQRLAEIKLTSLPTEG